MVLSGFLGLSEIREALPINCPLKVSNQNGQDRIDVVANTVFTHTELMTVFFKTGACCSGPNL